MIRYEYEFCFNRTLACGVESTVRVKVLLTRDEIEALAGTLPLEAAYGMTGWRVEWTFFGAQHENRL